MMAESQDYTAEHARLAAQIEADVGVERIADVYAQALLGAAEQAGQTQAVLEEFDALITGVLAQHPKLAAILAAGLISHEEKAGMLDRLFAGRLSPLLLNCLKVVSRHGRLDCLRAIHRRLHVLYDRARGLIHVRLSTAAPVSGALAGRIAASLRSVLGKEPVLDRVTDPALIGGAVLRIGDTVYDGSIANQLHVLREQMIQRSAHEIQSRRDRFRYPTGN
jgi:F-type H+-transporting ATPase subunit delta